MSDKPKLMTFKYAVPAADIVEIQAKLEAFMREGGVEFTNLGAWPFDPDAPTTRFVSPRKPQPAPEAPAPQPNGGPVYHPYQARPPHKYPEVGTSDAAVYDLMTSLKRPVATKELVMLLHMPDGTVSGAIHRLKVAGRVELLQRGVYQVTRTQ